ncbi:MAG TPA: CusA/CzcA family heavy metal efflux RND transporter [Polyangiaceae bacterium LLY-WYZ-15_(1-7)]|nr:CusA/CzcA family heavy metal efflux RND transporter [Sandaracinus sp.]HJL06514.1 CusA/CzcA family heavy metal efflux RND transporter [Polyangiaceae bacterium LLY-WYZ-15_(1-7)]HJL12569.1 CusA/CzcA family heavy metal efflux RND transporter [Polyangiaceae bacterium LLY-WYZ-15_(1-7)]HJL26781.1 CusA/CzcA family heavy metal efflux RND transporter [Polyangiaceae bacterium LLY-WYZ-15_(1-7)]HJL37375.1 CusA/CzcA family heavy metal efflux RND transporter [Polyangiaceae bacterium LLY-WYZ-15_(1-7)]
MKTFVSFCIQHRFLVIFGVLLIGALGVRAAQQLPIDAVPDVTNVQVQVLTTAPALGPIEVEQYITVPVETVMSGLPRVEQVRSLSRFGLSAVTIVFEEGTDIYFARQLVSERLADAREAIPEGYGSPELGPISSGLGEIYQFEVRGEPMCEPGQPDTPDCYTLMELRTILDWYVSYQLRPLPGVVEVNAFGGELKTYEVQVDPDRLNALNLSLDDVFEALEDNNANAGGGYMVRSGEQRVVRGEGLITSLDDIRGVRVATGVDGTAIFVRDVATVSFAPMVRHGAATRDGRGEVVTGVVMMLLGANSGEVSDRVRARIDELATGLPEGVTIETYYDRSELVDRTVRTVAVNLIEGGILVVVVLLLLLGNLRGGLLVASVIPLSLLFTFISMRFFGVSGNLMSLGALDFGLIIDGAIVVVENVSRRLSETRARGRAVRGVVRDATAQVIRPVLFGTAIIMIVYIPILSLQGIEGKMFRPMAIAVLSALAAALVLAVTLVPAASTWLFRGGLSEKEAILARLARKAYEPLLGLVLRFRPVVVLIAVLIFVGGGWLASRMGAEFVPRLDEGAIALQAVRPPSVSLEESVAATTRIERVLLDAYPNEIDTIVSRTGRAEIATDPMGIEISDIYLILHPIEEWTRADSKVELVERIDATLAESIAGQNFSFSQPIELRTNELISGVRSDVAVNLYGPDFAELEEAGERVMRVLRSVDGAVDVNASQVAGLPAVRIVVDREAAGRYGINASEILDAVSAIGGRPVGTVFEGQRRFSLQVRLTEAARANPEVLRELLVSAPGGERVPLGQVAQVLLEEGPAVVSRESAQRRMTIQLNVRGRDLAGFVAEAQERVRAEANLPPGYFVTWGGQFENLQAATSRLALAVPLALLLIFLLLYTTFGSARPALIIYLNIPMAAVGGVLALWLRGMPFSISAAVGFIALSGIAVLNGVVMVSYIRDLQREGLSLMDATEKGARLRLRAVLMTALTDGIGFLPMAISTSAGAEVQRPLATVVIGGLFTATLLTLFVLPAVYSWLGGMAVEEDDENEIPADMEGVEA